MIDGDIHKCSRVVAVGWWWWWLWCLANRAGVVPAGLDVPVQQLDEDGLGQVTGGAPLPRGLGVVEFLHADLRCTKQTTHVRVQFTLTTPTSLPRPSSSHNGTNAWNGLLQMCAIGVGEGRDFPACIVGSDIPFQ